MPRRVRIRPNPQFTPKVVPVVRVRPLNDRARQFIRHYPENTGFNDDVNGTPWPNDAFTQRRIRDGDIEVVEEAADTNAELQKFSFPSGTSDGPVKYGETGTDPDGDNE